MSIIKLSVQILTDSDSELSAGQSRRGGRSKVPHDISLHIDRFQTVPSIEEVLYIKATLSWQLRISPTDPSDRRYLNSLWKGHVPLTAILPVIACLLTLFTALPANPPPRMPLTSANPGFVPFHNDRILFCMRYMI
jgi:hypothetical protein